MSFFERHSKNQDKLSQAKEWLDIGKKHLENSQYDSAIEAFTTAISTDSNYEDAYYFRAKTYVLTQQYDKVIADCNVVTAINPERTGCYLMRGIAYSDSDKNQYEKAIEEYSKAISLDENLSLAFLKRGKVYTCLEQYDKAIDDFNRLITLNPDSSTGYQARGDAYILLCKFADAIDDFTRVLELTPDDAEALISRAGAYVCMSDNEKAVPDLTKACNMGHEVACEMLKKIDDIKNEKKPLIKLKEIEHFNIPPVDNNEAAMFTKRLTGNERFEFDGSKRPRSFLIHSLKYNYPRHSFAHGWLLSADVDSFLDMCNSGQYPTMEPILKKYVIGSIEIEYGGNLTSTQIRARKLSL